MSMEIEHFENRIAKVEEYIRQNKFVELAHLIQQLQDSLKVVRDLSFFEKQKQRIERFDKMIMTYMVQKENELVFKNDFYKRESANIRCLLGLERYFNKEKEFIENLIARKLNHEFSQMVQNQEVDRLEGTRFGSL